MKGRTQEVCHLILFKTGQGVSMLDSQLKERIGLCAQEILSKGLCLNWALKITSM